MKKYICLIGVFVIWSMLANASPTPKHEKSVITADTHSDLGMDLLDGHKFYPSVAILDHFVPVIVENKIGFPPAFETTNVGFKPQVTPRANSPGLLSYR